MEKYHDKYRIKSIRAWWWDYRWNGAYFITICTAHKKHFFGHINNNTMVLSPVGVIADILWHEIPNHNQYVELDNFVVMPNHIHGILILDKPQPIEQLTWVQLQGEEPILKGDINKPSSTPHLSANKPMASISPKQGSLAVILRSYKSAVTKHANRLGLESGWQTRYYDHIIRNQDDYLRICEYIQNNPASWNNDQFYSTD